MWEKECQLSSDHKMKYLVCDISRITKQKYQILHYGNQLISNLPVMFYGPILTPAIIALMVFKQVFWRQKSPCDYF